MTEYNDYKEYFSPVFAKYTDIVMKSGKDCYLYDENENEYLDFVQGIAVNALGHCHPRIVNAVTKQVEHLMDASFNLVNYESTLKAGKQICELFTDMDASIFFTNSGAEATDSAIKLARAATNRPYIISFYGSFHGRTMGATSVTGSNAMYRKDYEPLVGSVEFIPYPAKAFCPKGYDEQQMTDYCIEQLNQLFKYKTSPELVAAVIIEPLQGEGGYNVPAKSFMKQLRDICSKFGILLICDEIQSGYGRTGKMFAFENFDILPDIVTLGKAIGGGVPMSAVVSTKKIMNKWKTGTHGTTFGGNPVAGASALAVLEEFKQSKILENCNKMGKYFKEQLIGLKEKHSCISDVRGLGLMLAIEFSNPDGTPAQQILQKVKSACYEQRFLTISCGVFGNCMRFCPPLNITAKDIDKAISILDAAISQAKPE